MGKNIMRTDILKETQNKLTIILDTESLDKYYSKHKDQINKILSYYNRFPFIFMRIKGNCNYFNIFQIQLVFLNIFNYSLFIF